MSDTSSSDTEHPVHPLERLKKSLEKAEERAEKERVHCPECDTTVWKESVEEAIEAAENHDEKRHDGDRTTKVNGMLPPSDEFVEAVEDAFRSHNTGGDR